MFRTWEVPGPDAPVAEVDGYWLVSDHSLVRRVFTDPETFPPDNALDAVTPIRPSALRVLARYGFRLPPTLANNGSASHPGLRAVVAEAFHPDRVAAQRAWFTGVTRRRAVRLATRLRSGEPVDLHAGIAQDLPLRMLGRLVGLPAADNVLMKRFSAAALELFWGPVDTGRQRELVDLVGQFHARLRRFVRTGPDLAARIRSRLAGVGCEDEAVGVLFFLLVAGQETTSRFLTLLLHRLLVEPAVLTGVVHGRYAVADVVEEGLRLEPPIVTWRRVAARDVRLGPADIPRGAHLVLWLAAAGRDAELVRYPTRLLPGQRGSRRHLAFGVGAHRCLGDSLARMEAAVVVAELAPLLRHCRVVRAPWCPDNLSFRMPDALVVAR